MDDWCRTGQQQQQQPGYGANSKGGSTIESCEISYAGINSNSSCNTAEGDGGVGDSGGGCLRRLWRRCFRRSYCREAKEILQLHIPFFFTCFFQFFLQTVSVIMCGHLSARELAAAALACTLINVGAIGVGVGVSTACDTYFSQTFGSGNKKRVGLYLQRSLIVMYMVLVPVLCLQLNIKPVLLALGQEEDISAMAAEYMLIFLPGIFFDYTFLILSRYLQNQNLVYPPLVCAVVGNVFNAASQFLLIRVLGMRYQASAACQAASLFVMCAGILGYILVSRVYEATWSGWSREALYDLGSFMRLAVPGLILTLLEDLSYEVGTFVAGAIDSVQLAAQGIVFQTATLSFMLQLAMSIAVNIRVGHQLGGRDPEGAKHTFKVAHSLMTVLSVCLTSGVLLCRPYIARLFTSSPIVQQEAERILTIFAIFTFVDSFTVTNNGMLKGCGKQVLAAMFNVVGYEFVGLPIGIPLSLLTELKIRGMWIGLMCGVAVSGAIFTVIILRLDFKKLVMEAQVRAFGQTTPAAEGGVVEADESASLINGRRRSRCRSYSGRYENLAPVPELQTRPVVLDRRQERRILLRRALTLAALLALAVGSIVLRLCLQRQQQQHVSTSASASSLTTPAVGNVSAAYY